MIEFRTTLTKTSCINKLSCLKIGVGNSITKRTIYIKWAVHNCDSYNRKFQDRNNRNKNFNSYLCLYSPLAAFTLLSVGVKYLLPTSILSIFYFYSLWSDPSVILKILGGPLRPIWRTWRRKYSTIIRPSGKGNSWGKIILLTSIMNLFFKCDFVQCDLLAPVLRCEASLCNNFKITL